jgi:sugar lactone lactonase YvrE
MKLFFVLTVLLSFLGKAISNETAPLVSTLYAGPVSPVGIWSDAKGNIYSCETGFHSVFKITSGGVKTDFAGTRGTAGVASEGVLALNALFNSPRAVWGDGQFLYVTDSVNNRIRRVSWTTSLVSTIVGGGTGSILNSGSFPGTSVALTRPNAIAGSSNGKVYFADFGHVYMLDTETGLVGMVSFIAGGGDRIGTFAHGAQVSLKDIQGLAVDPTNNNMLFVADSGNGVVRKMDVATGHSIIFAGRVKKENFVLPSKPFENGEAAYKVKFGNPSSVWVGDDGSVFIADSLYHTISVVRHNKIYLFAGKWQSGAISNTLMTGPANQVQIEASHIFGDSSRGVLYLSDGTRGGIQQISPLTVNVYATTATPTVPPTQSPTVTPTVVPTVAPTVNPTKNPTERPTMQPSGQPTSQPSGQPTSQPTSQPSGQPTRQPSGQPTSQPSQPTSQPSVQPTRQPSCQPTSHPTSHPTRAPPPLIAKTNLDSSLSNPRGVWADAHGNVFVSDYGNHRIYIQSADGTVTTFVGSSQGFSGDDGDATEAQLNYPQGIWGDSNNLYICDFINGRIRAVNFATNKITTIAGGGTGSAIGADSQPAIGANFRPESIWGDRDGNLYITAYQQLLFYSVAHETIQSFGYSPSGDQTGADGNAVLFLENALARRAYLRQITGDASRNCLYVGEAQKDQDDISYSIIRKFDLSTNTATIFAGQLWGASLKQYADGATGITFSMQGPSGLWVANDGTVFFSDLGTTSISAINPNTRAVRWFAGVWNEWEQDDVGRADQDTGNKLKMGGLPKLGRIKPQSLTGNGNSLYVVDQEHKAVRKVSPLFKSPAVPAGRRLEENEIIPSLDVLTALRFPVTSHLRGSV